MSHAPRWRQQLLDAHALLIEANQLSGPRRDRYLIGAARLVYSAGSIGIPRDPVRYEAWHTAVVQAEDAVYAASGEYPASLALNVRQRRRIDAALAAGRADVYAGRVSGPFASVEEGLASLRASTREALRGTKKSQQREQR